MGTSNHLNIQLAGTGRAFNSRIYRDDYGPLVGIDMGLVSQYTLKGDLLSIITANTSLVKARDSAWLVQRAWSTLLGLAETSSPSSVKDMLIRGLFLGESMPEKLFADILDVFSRKGDVQMTGLLACLVELDRRSGCRLSSVTLLEAYVSCYSPSGFAFRAFTKVLPLSRQLRGC